jgi:hypothetical protein
MGTCSQFRMGEISPNPSFSKRRKFSRRIFSLFSGAADTLYYHSLTVMWSVTRIDPTSPLKRGIEGDLIDFPKEGKSPLAPLF